MARYGRYGGLEPERFEGSRMSQTLRIINPNWNTAVTESMSSALDGMRHDGGPQLDCVSLEGGPSALKARQIRYASRRSSRKTPNPTTRRMRSSSCYDITDRSRIAECAYARPVRRNSSPPTLQELLVRPTPLGLSIANVEGGADTFSCMSAVGQELRDEDGADVIIMDVPGWQNIEPPWKTLGVPVIDPTRPAASIAL